jgi:hypothetical protein
VRDERRSEREDERSGEPATNHGKIQGLKTLARCQIRVKNFDKAKEHAEAIGKLSNVDRNEIEAEIAAARGTS